MGAPRALLYKAGASGQLPLPDGHGTRPLPVYTREEVAAHHRPDDCWLIARGKVYDVTPFLTLHPGGGLSLLRKAGRDCTHDFEFHTSKGRKLWKHYQVGTLDGAATRCGIM